MRAALVLTFSLLLVAPSVAAADDVSDLRAAQERWAAAGIEDYTFHIQVGCFCPPHFTREHKVTVRNGKAVNPPKPVRRYSTIPKLFGVVQGAIADNVDRLDVRYGRTGMPRHIFIDRSFNIADEELTLTASHLRPR